MDGDINMMINTQMAASSSSSLNYQQRCDINSDGCGANCEIDWVRLLCDSSSLELDHDHQNPKYDHDDDNVGEGKLLGHHYKVSIGEEEEEEEEEKEEGDEEEGIRMKNKGKMVMGMMNKSRRNGIMPRIAFQTKSVEDVLDDGYRWRKYGQKAVKHSKHPRSYYRCTHHTCNVKKQIQRNSKDPTIVVTTYEGIHNHPSEKLMETLSPLLKQLQFLSGI